MEHVRIAVAQLPVRPPAEGRRVLDDAVEAVRRAADLAADMVLLPQLGPPAGADGAVVPGWGHALARLGRVARDTGMHVAMGLMRPSRVGARARSVVVLFDAAGHALGLRAASSGHAEAGRRRPLPAPLDTRLGRFGLVPDAELAGPEPARALAFRGASLLLVPGPWPRPPTSTAADSAADAGAVAAELDRVRARACENGVPIARAAYAPWAPPGTDEAGAALFGSDGRRLARVRPGTGSLGVAAAGVRLMAPQPHRVPGAEGATSPARVPSGPPSGLFAAVAAGPDRGAWAEAAQAVAPDLLVTPAVPRGAPPEPWLARVASGRARLVDPAGAVRDVRREEIWRTDERLMDTAGTTVAVVFGDEALAPEPVRLARDAGARLVVLFADGLGEGEALFWGRVRARENGVAIVVSDKAQGALLAANGCVVAESEPQQSAVAAAWLVTPGGA